MVIGSMEIALDVACDHFIYHLGTCPADLRGWEHPDTCKRHCDEISQDAAGWVGCWKLYFMQQALLDPKDRDSTTDNSVV
jgi:hypothetical protein